jgi:hypothetical protein
MQTDIQPSFHSGITVLFLFCIVFEKCAVDIKLPSFTIFVNKYSRYLSTDILKADHMLFSGVGVVVNSDNK